MISCRSQDVGIIQDSCSFTIGVVGIMLVGLALIRARGSWVLKGRHRLRIEADREGDG